MKISIAAFALTLFAGAAWAQQAQVQDINAPTLTAFSFTPGRVSVGSAPANVVVTFSATDDISGVTWIGLSFQSPSGAMTMATFTAAHVLAGRITSEDIQSVITAYTEKPAVVAAISKWCHRSADNGNSGQLRYRPSFPHRVKPPFRYFSYGASAFIGELKSDILPE